jgi:GPN-loop GTPase
VNLDPANDQLPYDAAVDIREVFRLESVMEEHKLGPNGGIMHCMESLEKNLDWLRDALEPHKGTLS